MTDYDGLRAHLTACRLHFLVATCKGPLRPHDLGNAVR